jgi:hypothetical protein
VLLGVVAVSTFVLAFAATAAAALGLTHAVGHACSAELSVIFLLCGWRLLTLVLVYLGCVLF